MTEKEFWLKLFSENDTALASVLILVDRFVTEESLASGAEYIEQRKKELYNEMPEDKIKLVFPGWKENQNDS